jgi:hypothetical protein
MNLPRSVFTANFKIAIGHDFLQKHLCRIGVVDSPICVLCPSQTVMDFTHLTSCPALSYLNSSTDNFISRLVFIGLPEGLWSMQPQSGHRKKIRRRKL